LEDPDALLLLEAARASTSTSSGVEASAPLPFFASGMVQEDPSSSSPQHFSTPPMSMHDRRALDILRSVGEKSDDEEDDDLLHVRNVSLFYPIFMILLTFDTYFYF
jgi:hypothetical protein